ncbi:HNH endonuclease [Paraburkholderia tropica]|uniref:HNH endonuclease n=1 Tax=Paraburkholderia tropica TaxID=92647 RepID=UPI003019EDE8
MIRDLWLPREIARLKREYPTSHTPTLARSMGRTVSSVYQKALGLGLRKSAEYLASPEAGRTDGKRGGSTRFKPGHVTWNKGLKGVAGVQEACRRTQFKEGFLPHNTLPIGSLRINKDGHLQRKVCNGKGSASKRWRNVAELVWCGANGQMPPRHFVVFRPGMFTNKLEEITLDRVECISMAENARRNHPRNKSPELAKLVQLKGAITRQVNRIAKEAKEQS